MAISWAESINNINWEELSDLYHAAPLGNKNAFDLEIAFTNSRFVCFAFEEGKLIGAGRAIADGVDCAYICDIALLPSYQGKGLGGALVEKLLYQVRGHKKIVLYSVPGKENFYRKFGFSKMQTAMAIFEDQGLAAQRGYVES